MKAIEMYNVYATLTIMTKLNLLGGQHFEEWNKNKIDIQIVEV